MPKGRGLLVYNPTSGSHGARELVSGLVARAAARGLALTPKPTERAGHARELALDGLAQRNEPVDVIAVLGGDGTVAEVAGALVGRATPLAILPAGTTNVVAREYGLGSGPKELPRAEAALTSSLTRPLTVWPAKDRTSLIGVGIGFDARVMGHTVPFLKRHFGRVGIGYTATLEWLKYEFPRIYLSGLDASGATFAREATFAVAANTRRYGGEPVLSPFADPSDDVLELVLFTRRSRPALMRFYHRLSRGKASHLELDGVERLSVKRFEARSLAGYELEIQIDGDAAGLTPIAVGPAAGTILVVVPE